MCMQAFSHLPSCLLSPCPPPRAVSSLQGIFQYQRLVEGCIPLIRGYERKRGIQFDWIVRTRVDTYWSGPAPPLSSLQPSAYYIPYGTDCMGLNDR